MAVLYDARGNEVASPIDIVTGNTFTDARTISVLLAAVNAETVLALNGQASVMFDVRSAAGVLTFIFEGSVDGTNYVPIPAVLVTTQAVVSSVAMTTTHAGVYAVAVSGFRLVRCRLSAWTSGNITVAARGTGAQPRTPQQMYPTLLWVTATAAANTAATASLPAAGVGLFHYITRIEIVRNATAALAGTATLIHTSTNLPGSPAWSVGNAMAAGGTQVDVALAMGSSPLKSSVANTITTIVAAAGGAAVLNRVNVGYYVGL